MKAAIVRAVLLACGVAPGCSTETSIHLRPESSATPATVAEPLPGRVALVQFVPRRPEENPMIAGACVDLTSEFVAALRSAGLFREVQYPVLSTHRFEMTMEIEQNGGEENPTSTRLLMVPTILTLGLISPLVTLARDSHTDVVVRLKVRSDVVATYTARTDARVEYHWSWKDVDLTQGLRACITAAQSEIVRKMIDDRERLAALLTAPAKPAGP